MPSIDQQQQIIVTVKEIMTSADQARQALQAQLDGINQLPAALLRQAFMGDL